MVTRLCAIWLAVLAAVPFTAPFATFDLSDLVGGRHARNAVVTIAAPTASGAQTDNADDTAAPEACFQRVPCST